MSNPFVFISYFEDYVQMCSLFTDGVVFIMFCFLNSFTF